MDLAAKYGTPLYLMDENKKRIIEKLKRIDFLQAEIKKDKAELDELLSDPYIYDKYYGLREGGII